MSKGYFVVTGLTFALIAIVHAMRLAYRWHVEIDVWVRMSSNYSRTTRTGHSI